MCFSLPYQVIYKGYTPMLHCYFFPPLPEIFLLMMTGVVLLSGLFFESLRRVSFYLTQLTLAVTLAILFVFFFLGHGYAVPWWLAHGFVLDPLALLLKIMIVLTVWVTVFYANSYNESRLIASNDFYILVLLSTLGMLVLVSANNLLLMYLALELFSLPLYVMLAMYFRRPVSIEASVKYFIMGALATCVFLYGMSLIFGLTGSLDYQAINNAISHSILKQPSQELLLMFSLIFIVSGAVFKLGAAPFHSWVPDVYEGAPSSVTLFLSAAPKLAAFGMLARLLLHMFPQLIVQWQALIICIAVLSMIVGNFSAMLQTNFKRMLAYSSIAHIGYMLLGFSSALPRGYRASLFYIIAYSVMSLLAFGMVVLLSKRGFEAERIEDLAGLNDSHPWLAFLILLVMFSLAGIPPLFGFVAKLMVLEALIHAKLISLAVLAVLSAIVGAVYYIRVVKVIYFDEPSTPCTVKVSKGRLCVISINALALIFLGFFPASLIHLCHNVL